MRKVKLKSNAIVGALSLSNPHEKYQTAPKKQKGITLIALIITIIVMLILVGVTVTVALNGGLFTTAKDAAIRTQIEAEKEQLLSAVVAAIGTDAKVDFNYLDKNLPTNEWTGSNGIYTSPTGNKFTVSENGAITETGSAGGDTTASVETKTAWVQANYEAALAEAAAAGQTIEGTNAITDIAIGTDGNIVNLGLWNYMTMGDEDGIALASYASGGVFTGSSYKGNITEDGSIEGTIPQAICIKNGEQIEVKEVKAITYIGNTSVSVPPVIPSNVKDCNYLFSGCTSLTTAPTIPSSVINCNGMFSGCTSLTTAPTLPSNVKDCNFMFSGCTSLTTAPTIPSSVTNCVGMFSGCTSLTTAPTIPSGVADCHDMFKDCTSLTTAPTIPSSVTNCNGMFSGCTSLTTAPTIPSGVTDCVNMFKDCTSLTGEIVVNAADIDATWVRGMLKNVGSETHPITLRGTCSLLEEIKATGNSQYITIAN